MSEAMDNTRAYVSRFGGLVLFILAILVVGLLIYFTVRSAGDRTVNDDDLPAPETSQDAGRPETAGEPEAADEEPAGPQTEDEAARGGTPAAGSRESQGSQVAADADDLPNTGPESAVLGGLAVIGLILAGRSYLESRRILLHAAKSSKQ